MKTKIMMAAIACAAGTFAGTYTWNTSKLTGGYFDPASWTTGGAPCESFAPVNSNVLSFTGGYTFAPTFAADAGRLAVTGMWQVAANNTLKIAPPSGTEIFLGEEFGNTVDNAPEVRGALDLSGMVALQGRNAAPNGAFKLYGGGTIDIHGAGTVFGGINNNTGQSRINGAYGSQTGYAFRVRDGATATNLTFFLGNTTRPVFEFSGANTVVRNLNFTANGSFRMQDGFGYFTNGVTIADCSDLNFSGYRNTVVVDDAIVTNTAMNVTGKLKINNSRFYASGKFELSGLTNMVEIGGGSHFRAIGTNPGFLISGMSDTEVTIAGKGTLAEVLANGTWGGIVRIGCRDTHSTPFENFQARLTVKDGARFVVDADAGTTISESGHVGINIGQRAGGVPADNCDLLVLNGGFVTNMASTLVGGGYQANSGSNCRLVVSNGVFYSKYFTCVGDSTIQTGYPATNNVIEVIDGGTFNSDGYMYMSRAKNSYNSANAGASTIRVRNADFRSRNVVYAGADANLGGDTIEIGGTNGYANVYIFSRSGSADMHLKFSIPKEGQTSGKPYLDVRYSSTMSIPEAGVDADLAIDSKWANTAKRNYVDLMRISRGASQPDYQKQSDRLTTIMNSIPAASLGGCKLSIVTNAADTVFSNSGTFTLRLNASGFKGFSVMFR